MRYVYPYETEQDGVVTIVRFPDVPEAITQVDPGEDFYNIAHDCLVVTLRAYVLSREALPHPSAIGQRDTIALDALESAKLALYSAMREGRISNVGLAKRLGVTETVIRRLVDLQHRSHIGQVEKALKALGRKLEVRVKAA